jgi:hypothetical protein
MTAIEPLGPEALEKLLIGGDLAALTTEQRVTYYRLVCESLGLRWESRPFDYLQLGDRLTLYANKDCAAQLRRRDGVSARIVDRETTPTNIYVVVAEATMGDRVEQSMGAVSVAGLRGDALANAMMRAETKGKRRVTLAICGLGWLDQTEVGFADDDRAGPVTGGEAGSGPARPDGIDWAREHWQSTDPAARLEARRILSEAKVTVQTPRPLMPPCDDDDDPGRPFAS